MHVVHYKIRFVLISFSDVISQILTVAYNSDSRLTLYTFPFHKVIRHHMCTVHTTLLSPIQQKNTFFVLKTLDCKSGACQSNLDEHSPPTRHPLPEEMIQLYYLEAWLWCRW